MSVKIVIAGFVFSLIVTQPVLAEEPAPVTPDDQVSTTTAEPVGNEVSTTTAEPAGDDDLEQRIRAYRELYDERHISQKKHREEMLKRYEARQKARAERFEAMLKQREEREAGIAKEQEKIRDHYKGERDYLSEHNQELLDMALKRKEERIKQHEEMRRKAEKRREEFANYRSEMEGLSPEEMNAYIDERITEMSREMQQRQRAFPHPPWLAGPRWQPPPLPPRYPGPPPGR